MSESNRLTDMADEYAVAYEVTVWDVDGRNVTDRTWFQAEDEARATAIEVDRRRGPGSAKLTRLTWRGADPEAIDQGPVERESLPVIDPSDPELAEYLRLEQKFKGLRLPSPGSAREATDG